MPTIEVSSGLQTILTRYVHYEFHWMGDHWKQEIVATGPCQSIPRVWSVEGLTARSGLLAPASPVFQQLQLEVGEPGEAIATLTGRLGPRRFSGQIRVEEALNEVVIETELSTWNAPEGEPLAMTFLVESSTGELNTGEGATLSWDVPETSLVFESEPPAQVVTNQAGQGTIRLIASLPDDPTTDPTKPAALRYRWRYRANVGRQIWDREA